MAYFLRQVQKKKGVFLQMYETHWDKEKKQPRSKYIESFGYIHDLVSDEMPDPVAYYKEYVKKKNEERKALMDEETKPRAFSTPVEKYAGHFLLKTLLEELDVKKVIDILSSQMNFQFSIYDLIAQLIYARVINPHPNSDTASSAFPHLYGSVSISEDQIYDGCAFIGESYKKYIELFNHGYERYFNRDCSNVYFDYTNYYFEIDLPYEDKQKGPSKENRLSQALLLDSDLIPISMQIYTGNEFEKLCVGKNIEEMKQRNKVDGKIIQVADIGLNCARNIYTAAEASDGYIFSRPVQEKDLSEKEDFENDFAEYKDSDGNLRFKLKSQVDYFDYSFEKTNPETGKEEIIKFRVKEKRVISFDPDLAEKQKAEILKLTDEITGAETAREDPVDALKYAGYTMIVSSETDMDPLDIYNTYINLLKVEESFRIIKSFLEAIPVYEGKTEIIYGQLLICYLSLFLLRVLEVKCFDNEITAYELIEFMQDFRLADAGNDNFINLSRNQDVNEKIKRLTGLSDLDALHLTKKDIDGIFKNCALLDI